MTSWEDQLDLLENEVGKKLLVASSDEIPRGLLLIKRLQKVRSKYERWNIDNWKRFKQKSDGVIKNG